MMYPMMYELHHILRIINCSQRRHIVTRGEEGERERERERERESVRYGYDEGFPVRGTASHWGTFIDGSSVPKICHLLHIHLYLQYCAYMCLQCHQRVP